MYASKIVTHFRCIFSESESSKFFQRISLGISANNSIPLRIRSHCQGCLLLQLKSSVTVVSSALGTCTLYHWTHTGSIIIIKQSQPGTTTVPILHGCSRSRYKPVMAYLRFGAMRSCFGRPTKSSYSVFSIHYIVDTI